jgi:hypothetical protein
MIPLNEADRAYVLDRLDRAHVETVAANVRSFIFADPPQAVEACYQPGDGTWYSLVFAPLALTGAEGGGTGGQPPVAYNGRGVLVAYQQKQAMAVVHPHDLPDLEWLVVERFDVTPASQLAIAELLKEVFLNG